MKAFQFLKIRPHLLPVLLLLALTFAVYAGCFGHDFLSDWDDDRYVTANEAIKGFSSDHLRQVFTNYYVGNYAPVQMISYMADYTLWGLRAGGFVFTNVLFHALNGLLSYFLFFRVSGRRLWAFAAAFVFLLHPVQVESVAWISQRKNVLAMLFFLASILLYLRWRERGSGVAYAGSMAAFVVSLLAKSVAVILPPVLLLYDLCFVPAERRKGWLLDKLPYLAAAAAVALVALKSQGAEYEGGRAGWHGGSPYATFLTMLPVFCRYLGMLVWPAGLSAAYDPPMRTDVDAVVVGSALLLLLCAVIGWYLYRRDRKIFFWYALFWIGFLPVSQIVPLITLMNDRYLYFPMLGAAGVCGGLAAFAGERWKWGAVLAVLPLLVLPFFSHERSRVWKDAETLWSDATVKVPGSRIAWIGLAEAHHNQGRLDAALAAYQRAISIDPYYRDALNNLGVLYMEKGEPLKGRPFLLTAVERYPGRFDGFLNLGNNYYMTREFAAAEEAYRRALALRPDSPVALAAMGNVYLKLRRLDEAGDYYRRAALAGGETGELLYDRACLAAVAGRPSEALALLERAFAGGYRDYDNVLKDDDLESIRGLPGFRTLMERFFTERSRR